MVDTDYLSFSYIYIGFFFFKVKKYIIKSGGIRITMVFFGWGDKH